MALSILLEAAALKYAKASEAWTAQWHDVDRSGQEQMRRALTEARAQLQAAARRYSGSMGPELTAALAEVVNLRARNRALLAFKESVDEALNMGDGVYRP